MISPIWIEFNGLDDLPVYVSAGGAKVIESTPEGARILSDGGWIYVTEQPSVALERVMKATEFSTESTLWMVKAILDELTAGKEPAN